MARDTNSVDSGSAREDEKKPKSRRPPNTAFRQQRLKAWQPILTPKTVLPLLFIVGVIFAPLGGLMLYASAQVEELSIDYSNCVAPVSAGGAPVTKNVSDTETLGDVPSGNVANYFKSSAGPAPQWVQWSRTVSYYAGQAVVDVSQLPSNATPHNVTTPVCSLFFQIPDDIGAPSSPVLLYYRLTNFYQNHRRYVKSFDSDQLSGTPKGADAISSGSCDPLTNNGSRPYYPCGIVANSLFNDTFATPVALNARGASGPVNYNMTNQGIAWSSDQKLYVGQCTYKNYTTDIAVPPFWMARYGGGQYSVGNPPPNLAEYEAFQVWMRTAGLPAFSKLALRNDNETMTAGRYRLDIDMNFPVNEYGGTKAIVISTSTIIGGKNPFLGIAYIVVAGLCLLLGLAFTAAQLVKPRKLGDHTHLTWNNENTQASTATATGVQRSGADAS